MNKCEKCKGSGIGYARDASDGHIYKGTCGACSGAGVTAPDPASFAAEVIADDSGKWTGNALRFATQEQAETYAKDLYSRWTAVREWRVVPSADPVTEAA